MSELHAIKFSILFSAPEAIVVVEKWRTVLLNPLLSERVVAVAVDEAHCVSKRQVSLQSVLMLLICVKQLAIVSASRLFVQEFEI